MKARMGLFRHECYKAAVEHLADTCPQLELRQVSLSKYTYNSFTLL